MEVIVRKRTSDLGRLFCYMIVLTLVVPIFSLTQPIQICGNTNLTNYDGVIESPQYPLSYLSPAACSWRIHSPINSILKINIIDFDIDDDHLCTKVIGKPCCNQSYVSLPREGGRGYVKLCGSNLTMNPITVAQPETDIKFHQSRSVKRGRGFKISYTIDIHGCSPYDLQCFNRRCVSNSSLCNGIDDCGDQSDEKNCLHIHGAKKGEELESRNRLRESMGLCSEDKVPCTFSPNHCYSPKYEMCDGVFDCPKGEDEVNCDDMCPGQLKCSSGESCYTPVQRCNSVRNCKDNSDETGCVEESCGPLQFVCLNYACIPISVLCDGNDDCGDMSDEENCTKASLMAAAIIALLACVFLFVIGLGCLYRLYTIRLRASATFMQHLEPEPIDEDFIYREPPPAYSVAVGDTRIITYPTADVSERFFENDLSPRNHTSRCPRRSRRRQRSHNSDNAAIVRPRTRPTNSFPNSSNIHNNQAHTTMTSQNNPKLNEFKYQSGGVVPGQFELSGFRADVSTSSNNQNESPYSSPSLSPSRESVTSSTSLEDQVELVSTCQS